MAILQIFQGRDKIGHPLAYAVTKYVDVCHFQRCNARVGLRYFNVLASARIYGACTPSSLNGFILFPRRNRLYRQRRTSRDFCYIDNVVQANLLASCAGRLPRNRSTTWPSASAPPSTNSSPSSAKVARHKPQVPRPSSAPRLPRRRCLLATSPAPKPCGLPAPSMTCARACAWPVTVAPPICKGCFLRGEGTARALPVFRSEQRFDYNRRS